MDVIDIILRTLLALKYIKYICYKSKRGTQSSGAVNLSSLVENQDIHK